MDFENFDENLFNPQQTVLNRYLKFFGVLLLVTFFLPIDRGPVNVWDRFGVDGALTLVRLLLPALVGLGFAYLAWLTRLKLGPKAIATSGLLVLMLILGVNPFEILRVVLPPVTGELGEELFGMVDGGYFPREDTLHLVLLGTGLVLLGAGGRYRTQRLSSRIGSIGLIAGAVVLCAYYLVPYEGTKLAFMRNRELYASFHRFAEGLPTEEAGLAGQLKLSAAYFMVIYYVPVVLAGIGAGAWIPSRYKGHRTVFSTIAGWGASAYLLAFLLPMLIKESMRKTGVGFTPNLRSYIIMAAIFVGLTIALAMGVEKLLEPNASDDHLPEDPLAWKEQSK